MAARSFRLDTALIAEHRGGAVLALDPRAVGRSFRAGPGTPTYPQRNESGLNTAVVVIEGPLAQKAEQTLCGSIDGYDAITERFAEAMADPSVGCVVLVINSPGGDVAGLEEAVRRMVEMRDQARKPVYALADEWAASAAYWLAAGVADSGVYLPQSAGVGSIGTIAMHTEESAALEQDGVKVTLIRAPAGKAAGHPAEPLSDVGRARLESMVATASARFVAAMASARGMTPEAVRGLDGEVFFGDAAVKAGLADGVASLEQVLTMAAEAAGKRERTMKMHASVTKLLGVSAEASEQDVARAAEAAGPLLELGRATMKLTGASEPDEAEGTLEAWKGAKSTVDELTAKAAEREAADEERKKSDEAKERVELVRGAVVARKLVPAQAWVDPEIGPASGVAPALADMKIKALRKFIADAHVISIGNVKGAGGAVDVPDGLTANELRYCKAKGIDVNKWAESKAQISGAPSASSEA